MICSKCKQDIYKFLGRAPYISTIADIPDEDCTFWCHKKLNEYIKMQNQVDRDSKEDLENEKFLDDKIGFEIF